MFCLPIFISKVLVFVPIFNVPEEFMLLTLNMFKLLIFKLLDALPTQPCITGSHVGATPGPLLFKYV